MLMSLSVPQDSKTEAPGATTREAGKLQSEVATDTLSNTARRLPTLANHLFVVGEGQRADVFWTEADFKALCEHMLNENPPNHFLRAWIDPTSGEPRFAKALARQRADKYASWAYATITGRTAAQTSIGFYATNPEKKSRWGAIDFDAHDGEFKQARDWSLEAFRLLRQQPQQLHLILGASGRGFHLHVVTREFYPVRQWILLLKQTCEWIGAPITEGTCEIIPNERVESQPCGKAIRAPGTWNPNTGTCSLIELETVGPLLETLPRPGSFCVGKFSRALPRNNTELSLHKSTDKYSFTHWSISTKPSVDKILARYPIPQKGTRHGVLVQLVGHLSNKFGREIAQRIVEEHYRLNEENIRSTLDEHLCDFTKAWDGMRNKLISEPSEAEKQALDRLTTEHQREGFLIVRAFAGAADYKEEKDFPISQASLADRLNITPPGAGDVIRKLSNEEIIAPTQGYVRHKHSARFRWLLPHATDGATSSTSAELELEPMSAPLLKVAQKDMPQVP